MVARSVEASLLGSLFDGKQCREQFVTPLPCFSQPRCNSLAFRTPVLRLLLELDTYVGVDHLGVFPLFLKMVADIVAPKLIRIFEGSSVLHRTRCVGALLLLNPFPRVFQPWIRKTTVPHQ